MTMPSTDEIHAKAGVALDRKAALRQTNPEQLRHLGTRQVAYLRCGRRHGQRIFLLHGADGLALIAVDTLGAAWEIAAGYELAFVTVH